MCDWLLSRESFLSQFPLLLHTVEAEKNPHKPKTCPSKNAAVSPGIFTCRGGSLMVVPAATAVTSARGGWTRARWSPFFRGCTEIWLSPPGTGGVNCQWPSSPGLILTGGFSGIEGRWVSSSSVAPLWPADTKLGDTTTGPSAPWGLPGQGRGYWLCAQLAVVQSGAVGWFLPKPLKNVLRAVGEGHGRFFLFILHPHLFLHCSCDPGKREPCSCSGIWVRVVQWDSWSYEQKARINKGFLPRLYIIRQDDVIGSWRGEQTAKLQPSAARQSPVQGGAAQSKGQAPLRERLRTQGLGAQAWRGCGLSV